MVVVVVVVVAGDVAVEKITTAARGTSCDLQSEYSKVKIEMQKLK